MLCPPPQLISFTNGKGYLFYEIPSNIQKVPEIADYRNIGPMEWNSGGGDADTHQYPLLLGNETRFGFTITNRGHFTTVCTLINVKSDEHLKMKFVGLGSAQ